MAIKIAGNTVINNSYNLSNIQTSTSNITFTSNTRLKFGDSANLQIFHNSGANFIQGFNGTGIAIQQSNAPIYFMGNSTTTMSMVDGGATTIFFDGVNRLQTSATGVAITGIVTGNAVASSGQFSSNTSDKLLSTNSVWSVGAEVTLTDTANITLNLNNGINFKVTIAGNRTLTNPTNVKEGQTGRIRVIQSAYGSNTLAFGSAYVFANNTAPYLSTAAGAEDILYYDCITPTKILINAVNGVE